MSTTLRRSHVGTGSRPFSAPSPSLLSFLALSVLVVSGCNGADAHPPEDAMGDRAPADWAAVAQNRAAVQSSALHPASVDVGYTMGDPDAPIAVVEFSDFGCPYCARFATGTLPTLEQEFIDEGIVRWRYVPVTFGFAGGELMGAAAVCSAQLADDETFWRVHDLFYQRQVALRGEGARERILEWLGEFGVDRAALDSCMGAPETRQLLDRNNEASAAWFVRGTPTFVVNGVPMSGAMPVEFFRKVFGTALDPSGM